MLRTDPAVFSDLFSRVAGGRNGPAGLPPTHADPRDARAWVDGFSDERGHRRRVDRPLLARLVGADPGPPPPPPPATGGETLLWWAVHDPALDPWPQITPSGPLLGLDRELGIEAWTESEFAALHAAWWLAHDSRRPPADRDRLAARVDVAARWHLAETQPDNGTNHPWAIHVFARLAPGEPDAGMYVDTMLHNAQLAGGRTGRPDRFSAVLLLDAAEAVVL